MAVQILSNPLFTWAPTGVDPTGMKLFTYAAGTSTKKGTWQDTSKSASHTNPIILNSLGQPNNGKPIIIDGSYKFVIAPSNDTDPPASGTVIADNYSSEPVSSVTGNFNLVINGSFEDDSNTDGTPDGWTISELTGGSIATDTTDVAHGTTSLLFTSTTAGGGTATSESFFPVLAGSTLNGIVSVKSSSATNHNIVEVYWYTKADVYISKSTIYDEAAANPTSWTQYSATVTAPATATQAKIVCTGVAADSTTLASTCRFDDVKLQEYSNIRVGLVGSMTQAQLDAYETLTTTEIGYSDDPNTANKFCLLDGSADVPLAQIPDTLTGKNATLHNSLYAQYGSTSLPSCSNGTWSSGQTIALTSITTVYGVLMFGNIDSVAYACWGASGTGHIIAPAGAYPASPLIALPSAGNLHFSFYNGTGGATGATLKYIIYGT